MVFWLGYYLIQTEELRLIDSQNSLSDIMSKYFSFSFCFHYNRFYFPGVYCVWKAQLIFTLDKSTVEIPIGNWTQTFGRHWKSFIKQSFVNRLSWPPVSAVLAVSSILERLSSQLGWLKFRKSNHFLYRSSDRNRKPNVEIEF